MCLHSGICGQINFQEVIKKAKIIVLGIALFLAGYVREFVFESINSRLGALSTQKFSFELTSFLSVLNSWSYSSLYIFKYFLTFLFAAIFLALSLILVKIIFNKREYLKITVIFFAAIFSLSFLLFGIGYITGFLAQGYTVSRYIIEFIESPLAPFFLISAMHLYNKNAS